MQRVVVVFLVGTIGIWKAVLAGFLLKVSPVLIFLMTVLGASTGVLIIYTFGKWIKSYITGKKNSRTLGNKQSRARNLFEKYGVIGFAMLGTILMGPQITMVMGLIIVKTQKKLLLWIGFSILVWTGVLTILATLGIELFTKLSLFSHPESTS
jgi:membrane protein DedA with SNARE-associated domain